ncbi:MAG: C40 family peptidase [Lachnospiraceae bacterium]|nr:C40 family peptidase [Candidatus Colinaster scatohippi]
MSIAHFQDKKIEKEAKEEEERVAAEAARQEEIKRASAYEAKSIQALIDKAGAATILDGYFTEEEYLDSAKGVSAYGYNNLGIANVSNHLNVRKEPNEGGKLVGKMSNNAACEILGIYGDWYKIKSGEVEGYCHSDYLLVGQMALLRGSQIITKEAESTSGGLRVREEPTTMSEILTVMGEGERLEVLEDESNGWIKVLVDDQEGYIAAEFAEVKEELQTAVTMSELMYGQGVSELRVDMVQYAKQFIGNPYVWGGTSLTNGADCSGFVLSVFKKYGISLPHSSRAQATMGKQVSLGEARPGDLVFYSSGGRINHVAIYIGGGQVVHASNPRTGIRISGATYRTVSTVRRIIND